ncbi:MAG: hypothetical protein DRI23_11390 [Candidatus Cloacimonadota bacterium]|nr:MAG: hypothetical protein DRI23_11390 [Candidatus Cloacimonadota bacterium]
MKKKIFTLIIVIMMAIAGAESDHNLGIAIGAASGAGFSYRHYNDTYGYQVNFVAIGTKEYFFVPIGAKVMKPFHDIGFSKAYYFAASSVLLDIGTESENDPIFSIGGGIGMEYTVKGNLKFSMDLPLTIADIFKSSSEEARMIAVPVPEISLYYNF